MTNLLDQLNALRAVADLVPVKKGSYTKAKMEAMIAKLTPVQVEEPAVEEPTVEEPACPLCKKADPSDITAAGLEGTFLGDNCNLCHQCGRVFNIFTGEEVKDVQSASKAKRRILNPQSKVDAKTQAAEAVGVKIKYDRVSRLWQFYVDKVLAMSMTSRDFTQYSTPEMTEFCKTIKSRA